tara:strand:- start:1058 stop:5881 length:4824 start_codon:yes stop_codon:yes gene_type:complete
MQNADEIIIEVSRQQASYAESNASWTVKIPPIIIEEQDNITCLGSWLSVKNSGDDSIEIFDENNPNEKTVPASFDINMWKTLDSQNVVSFPYHSMKWSNEDNLLGGGFSVPCYNNNVLGTRPLDEPTFTFTNASGTTLNNQPVTTTNTYETLLNYKNADEYQFHFDLYNGQGNRGYTSYLNFMTNVASLVSSSTTSAHPQGMLDEANTGNRYCLMWRQDDGTYVRYKKRVDVDFPIGYYTPENIATFITDQMNLTYYQDIPPDSTLKETWTPAYRYFEALFPLPIPHINLTAGIAYSNRVTPVPDPLGVDIACSLNTALFEPSGNTGTENTITKSTGFTRRITATGNELLSVSGTIPSQTIKIKFKEYSATNYEYENLEWLRVCLDEYSGTTGVNTKSWSYRNHIKYGKKFNPFFYFERIGGTGLPNVDGIFGFAESTLGNPAMTYNEDGDNRFNLTVKIITQTTTDTLTSAYVYNPPTQSSTFSLINIYWGGEIPTEPFGGAGGSTQTMGEWIRTTTSPVSLFDIATELPPSMPMYVGAVPNSNLALNGTVNSPKSIYNWLPIGFNELQTNSMRYVRPAGNNVLGIGRQFVTGMNREYSREDPVSNKGVHQAIIIPKMLGSRCYTASYQNGQASLGGTYGNFHRWNLKNDEEPPFIPYNSRLPTEQPQQDYPLLMPILRKYPLFMENGMNLNTTITDTTISSIPQKIGMFGIQASSTVSIQPIDQSNNYIVENYPLSTLELIQARCKLWADFIQAQIDDGLTRTTLNNDLPNNRDDFMFFTHIVIQTTQNVTDPFYPYATGTDIQLRNRARGLVCRINRDAFLKRSPDDNFSGDSGTYYGIPYVLISGNYYIKILSQSWIYDDLGGGGNNFGFMDYNNCDQDRSGVGSTGDIIDLSGTLYNAVTPAVHSRIGFGYCYKKSSWRNFTAMLCSYKVKNNNPEYLFNPEKNRLPTQAGKNYGDITYQTRVGVGAINPSLIFSEDGSSRFYFQQLYSPQTVTNRWYDGISNTDNIQLISSINFPILTYTYQKNAQQKKTNKEDEIIPDFSIGFSLSQPAQDGSDNNFSNNFTPNTQFGDDCVYYNRSRWDTENEGFYQFALEMPKLQAFSWFQGFPAGAGNVGNDASGVFSPDWNTPTGNQTFSYQYPVDTDFTTRFFCFNQQARYNSWSLAFEGADISGGKPFFYPDSSSNTIGGDKYYNTAQVKGINPIAFWGCCSGEHTIINYNGTVRLADRSATNIYPNQGEPLSSCGTILPNPESVYAEKSGISMDTFYSSNDVIINLDNYTTPTIDTFTNSFWNILGFTLTDLVPEAFQYCNQVRNQTVNFLTNDTNVDDVDIFNLTAWRSRPMTTQANLPSNFNIVQGNRVGTIQDTSEYPSLTTISTIGITAINRNIQNVFQVIGGVVADVNNAPSDGSNLTNPANLEPISLIDGGVSLINQQLQNNQFYILLEQSTEGQGFGIKVYSTGLASKIDDPFYLVRSDLPDDNYKYVNNSGKSSILPVVAVANKQFGATSDFYYSDANYLTFTNRRKRVISSVSVEITNSAGFPATVLEGKSTIFFRIVRNAVGVPPEDDDLLDDQSRLEATFNKKQKALLQEEIKSLLFPSAGV